jgi:hypothetical protein
LSQMITRCCPLLLGHCFEWSRLKIARTGAGRLLDITTVNWWAGSRSPKNISEEIWYGVVLTLKLSDPWPIIGVCPEDAGKSSPTSTT